MGMVDRHLERFGPLEDGPEELVVEVAAPGVAIDHGALEAVFADRTLQLIGRRFRRRGRQRGEGGEPVWMASHRVGEAVVGLTGERHRLGRVELLHARSGQRQHLHIDAGRIHVRDPVVAEIAELLDELGVARQVLPGTFDERPGRVVLFERDRAWPLLSQNMKVGSHFSVLPSHGTPSSDCRPSKDCRAP